MSFTVVESSRLGESIYNMSHGSGLEIIVVPKPGHSKIYAIFATKYGSIDNCFRIEGERDFTEVPAGIAHFLEHKLFESEKGNAFDKYAKTGASANAFTSFDKTAYLFSCTDKFEESLDILLEFVQAPHFTPESVAKEQGIIGQEIRMYEDDPNWRVFFNLLGCLYHNHPVKTDIAGTIESIAKIDDKLLYRCYNTFYNLGNMVLCVAGDVSPEAVYRVAKKRLKKEKPVKIERKFQQELETVAQKRSEQRLSVSVPLFGIGFKDSAPGLGLEHIRRDAVMKILLELIAGESSRLYQRLYTKGFINSTFATEYMSGESYGLSVFSGESKNPDAALKALLEEVEELRETGVGAQDFERCRRVVYGRAVSAFNSVERIANSAVSCYFLGATVIDTVDVFFDVTLAQVNDLLKEHFSAEKSAMSVILPL